MSLSCQLVPGPWHPGALLVLTVTVLPVLLVSRCHDLVWPSCHWISFWWQKKEKYLQVGVLGFSWVPLLNASECLVRERLWMKGASTACDLSAKQKGGGQCWRQRSSPLFWKNDVRREVCWVHSHTCSSRLHQLQMFLLLLHLLSSHLILNPSSGNRVDAYWRSDQETSFLQQLLCLRSSNW